MNRKNLYLILAIVGSIAPVMAIAPFLLEHGIVLPHDILAILFSTPIGAVAGYNVLIGCAVLVVLMHTEGRALGIKTWKPMVAMSLFGISSGLPLYLYLREGLKAKAESL
jgi:hypothetical protein